MQTQHHCIRTQHQVCSAALAGGVFVCCPVAFLNLVRAGSSIKLAFSGIGASAGFEECAQTGEGWTVGGGGGGEEGIDRDAVLGVAYLLRGDMRARDIMHIRVKLCH